MNDEKIIQSVEYPSFGITFHQGESGRWKCPVCGHFVFDHPVDFSHCPVCDAPNDAVWYNNIPALTPVTLVEAQRQWEKNGNVKWNWK